MRVPEPRIIGIDTASDRMHWCANFEIGGHVYVPGGAVGKVQIGGQRYGWVRAKNTDPDFRRKMIVDYTWSLFKQITEPFHVYCEEPLALQNGKTTRLLGLAAGAIYAMFVHVTDDESTWTFVDQSSWKKEVLGRGVRPRDYGLHLPKPKREKAWISETVMTSPEFLSETFTRMDDDFLNQQDLCDAWALRQYGIKQEVQR